MTPLLVALTTIGCLMMFSRDESGGTRRLLAGENGPDDAAEGLREVFPQLLEERRFCRYHFARAAGAPLYCEDEFECAGCHVHHKLRLSGIQQVPDLLCEEQVGGCRFNPFRFYHRGHTWARIEGDALVRVGMDPLARRVAAPPTYLTMPEVESTVEQGETAFSVETMCGAVLPFLSPISGEVVAINEKLQLEPARIADESKEAWTMVIRPFELTRELQNLLFGNEALEWFLHESRVLRELVHMDSEFAADGGTLRLGNAADFPWKEFVTNFLISA